MINISYNPNFLLAIILIIGMILFYSLRIVRPEVSKEEDVFFTTLGLLYSCIMLVHGWRLDPILFLVKYYLLLLF